jgi:hypothetical protein
MGSATRFYNVNIITGWWGLRENGGERRENCIYEELGKGRGPLAMWGGNKMWWNFFEELLNF